MTNPLNRYPGARPFGDSPLDRAMFFGREDESRALLLQLLSTDLLVFFGKSGLGKSSLISAGLFPGLRERDFLPLPVRFNHSDAALTPIDALRDAIGRVCTAENIDYTPGTGDTFWEFFKTSIFWRGLSLQTPVLVLDQFEELFTLQNEKFRRATAAQLGQLSGRLMPKQLRDRIKSGETLPFSDKPPQIKILLSLREDFLGALQELVPDIPAILQNRFRITGLSPDGARAAITKPAQLEFDEVTFGTRPFTYRPSTVDEIIATARDDDGSVEPFFLQILCSHIEGQIRGKQATGGAHQVIEVDGSYLGGKEGIKALTGKFYLGALGGIAGDRMRLRARRLCEDGLLTEGGRRRSALKEDLESQFGVDRSVLDILEQSRLLRKEPRHGSYYYEISHDRLAVAVQESRGWRMPRELKIAIAAAAVLLGIALVGMGLYARDQRSKGEHAEELVRSANELAQVYNHVLAGDLYSSRRKWDLAQNAFSQALESWKQRATRDPANPAWQREMAVTSERIGNVQSKLENPIQAVQNYQSAHLIWENLANIAPGNPEWQRSLAASHDKIALVRLTNGNPAEALSEYEKARGIREALARQYPDSTDDQAELASIYETIGELQRGQGSERENGNALASFEAAQKIREQLSNAAPLDDNLRHALAASYDRNGELLRKLKRDDAALANYKRSLELLEKLNSSETKNAVWQRDLSVAYNRIGESQFNAGNPQGALALYDKALKIREDLIDRDPFNTFWQRDAATSYANRGDALSALSQLGDALAAQRKSLELSEKVGANVPGNIDAQLGVAQSQLSIAQLLVQLGGGAEKGEAVPHALAAHKILRLLNQKGQLTDDQKELIERAENILAGLGSPITPPDGQ